MTEKGEDSKWSLSSSDVAHYRQHVQARIVEDLQDSLDHLNDHHDQLQSLLKKLLLAKQQVVDSVSSSRSQVALSCSTLLTLLSNALNNREQLLLTQLKQIEDQSLTPLLECEAVLNDALKQTQQLLQQGNTLAESSIKDDSKAFQDSPVPHILTKDRILKFQKDAALDNCLPSVPELCSVACVSATFPSSTSTCLVPLLQQYGNIRRMAPVQITLTEERPGALLVGWEEAEDDEEESCVEQREYVLQCSHAHERDQRSASYTTVYTGPDDRYLVQKLRPGCQYWLRVSHVVSVAQAADGRGSELEGSSWSLPKQCSTSLPSYRWQPCSMWRVADDGRLACKEGPESALVMSQAPQLAPDYTLTFQVVCGGGGCSDEGVALSWVPLAAAHDCVAPGALFLSATGSVVIDGEQRLMRLPSLDTDSTVSFTVEQAPARPHKLRIHIDTQDKQVTYEWPVPPEATKMPRLYFSACFAQPHWAVRVY